MPTRRSVSPCGRARWPRRRRRWPGARSSASSTFPAGTGARGFGGPPGAPAGLRRFGLFPALQPHAAGHPRGATSAVMADLLSRDARPDGSLYRASLAKSSPVEVLNQPLFNPTGGYASYIVPAAFMLILQQTMLMGSATLGGAAFAQGGAGRSPPPRRRRCRPGAGPAPTSCSPFRAPCCSSSCCRALYGVSATDAAGRSLRPAHSVHAVRELPRPVRQHVVQAAARRRFCFSSPRACPCSSSSACPGRSRRSPARSGWRASSFPARRRSTAWCASTRWARRWTTFSGTGPCCGRSRRSTACSPSGARGSSSAKGPPMDAHGRRRLILGLLAGAAAGGVVALVVLVPRHAPPPPLAGMVRQTEIRIAPEISGRLTSVAVRAGKAVRKGELLASSTIPSWRHRWARPRRRPPPPGPNVPTSMPACATRNGRSSPRSVETAEANLLLAEQEDRARSRWRRGTSPASRSSTRAMPRWPRPGPTSTSSAPSSPPRAPGRPPRSARWPTPGWCSPRRRSPTCRRSSTRPGWWRRSTASSASWSPKPGEVVPGRQAGAHPGRGQREMVLLHPARGCAGTT